MSGRLAIVLSMTTVVKSTKTICSLEVIARAMLLAIAAIHLSDLLHLLVGL